MTTLAELAAQEEAANVALRQAILNERGHGRTLQAIADEIGWTRAGVAYVVNKARKAT